MSWHFLQAAAEESWGDSCLVGAPAALLSMTPTVAPAFFNDNLKGTCIVSPCGMTLRRSTGTRGMDSLTWYQGDSPVRTYLPPARVEASGQAGRDSGPSSPGSLAKFNPHLYGWRTAQCLLDGGLMSFAETWPRWGMMQGGELFPLPTPSGLTLLREVISQYSTTFGNESGFSQRVPTPNSSEGDGGGQNPETGKREGHQLRLRDAVKRVPTPRSEDSQCSGGHRDKDDTLYGLICRPKVTRLGTPRKADYKGCGPVGGGGAQPHAEERLSLRPSGDTKDSNADGEHGERGRESQLTVSDGGQTRNQSGGRGTEGDAGSDSDSGLREGRSDEPGREAEERAPASVGGWWQSEPGLGRVATRVANRVDRLSTIGDGQCPAVVKLARELLT